MSRGDFAEVFPLTPDSEISGTLFHRPKQTCWMAIRELNVHRGWFTARWSPPRAAMRRCLRSLSLSFCLAPRVFVPLPSARELILSLCLSLFLSFSLHLPLLLVPRTRVIPSACTVLYRCVLLRSMRSLTLLYPAPRLFCGQRKGGEFGPWKRERISGRERPDSSKRQ